MSYKGKTVGVVVPAYNEELLIGETIGSMPDYVDRVYVVNDCSKDRTAQVVTQFSHKNPKVVLENHMENGGVGAAIVTGFKRALRDRMDLIAVMAGDNQMDPKYLPSLMDPIIEGEADFTKGNRLKPGYWKGMSKWRLFGNFMLSVINKIASGYWNVDDPQNGYVCISSSSLKRMDLDRLYKRYAFENDMMIKANIAGLRMHNVSIPARYGREKSKIVYNDFIVKTSIFLLQSFFYRISAMYVARALPHGIKTESSEGLSDSWDIQTSMPSISENGMNLSKRSRRDRQSDPVLKEHVD